MQDNQRQTHWAYVAGILDADGCFMISKHSRKCEHRKWKLVENWAPTYMPCVKIAMIEIEAIDFIEKELGYGKHNIDGARKDRINSKSIFHWYLRGVNAVAPFLIEVIPYLKVKKNRAEHLLEFCTGFTKYTSSGVPPHELEYREDMYRKAREFNGTKVAATTESLRPEKVSDSLDSRET